jgi:hypothetical protein
MLFSSRSLSLHSLAARQSDTCEAHMQQRPGVWCGRVLWKTRYQYPSFTHPDSSLVSAVLELRDQHVYRTSIPATGYVNNDRRKWNLRQPGD